MGTTSAHTDSYWDQSRSPWSSLWFVFPGLLAYEAVTLLIERDSGRLVRNGADLWLRSCCTSICGPLAILPPLLLVGSLVLWHHRRRDHGRLAWDTLPGMFAESLLWAFLLVALAQAQATAFGNLSIAASPSPEVRPGGDLTGNSTGPEQSTNEIAQSTSHSQSPHNLDAASAAWTPRLHPGPEAPSASSPPRRRRGTPNWSRLVSYLGAGLYEEWMFRLAAIPLLVAVLLWTKIPATAAVALAIFLSSLGFSAAHYVGQFADPFTWSSFLFRFAAGVYFSLLYQSRGYGIAAGSHALYDVLVGWALLDPNA